MFNKGNSGKGQLLAGNYSSTSVTVQAFGHTLRTTEVDTQSPERQDSFG